MDAEFIYINLKISNKMKFNEVLIMLVHVHGKHLDCAAYQNTKISKINSAGRLQIKVRSIVLT